MLQLLRFKDDMAMGAGKNVLMQERFRFEILNHWFDYHYLAG